MFDTVQESLEAFEKDNADIVAELQAKFPDIEFVAVEKTEQIYGIVPASRPVLEKFMGDMDDKKKRLNAMEHFVAGCMKYPEASILWGQLKARPGLVFPLSDQCSRISGLSLETERKKL